MRALLLAMLVLSVSGAAACLDRAHTTPGDGAVVTGNEPLKERSSPKDTTYRIEGRSFTLQNGSIAMPVAAGSATTNRVSVVGEPAYGDIDGDGDEDAAVVLLEDSGGSGSFYYAAVAVNSEGAYRGTDAMLLGDRVDPQNVDIASNRARFQYLDRAPGESFTTPPRVPGELHVQVDGQTLRLVRVAVDFEGEADPDRMTLGMKTWTWIKTAYNNDTEVAPSQADAFTLTFADDGRVSISTDCNSMRASYEVSGHTLSFGPMMATRMYCEGSQESEFAKMLGEVKSFLFTSRGNLVLELPYDSGSMIFR